MLRVWKQSSVGAERCQFLLRVQQKKLRHCGRSSSIFREGGGSVRGLFLLGLLDFFQNARWMVQAAVIGLAELNMTSLSASRTKQALAESPSKARQAGIAENPAQSWWNSRRGSSSPDTRSMRPTAGTDSWAYETEVILARNSHQDQRWVLLVPICSRGKNTGVAVRTGQQNRPSACLGSGPDFYNLSG